MCCLEKGTEDNLWVYPQTHCDGIAALSGEKPLILSLRATYVIHFNKCPENDSNVIKSVALIF